jgi:hypothetical protein
LRVYELSRAGGGLLATRVALVHTGHVVRPVLAVDTGSVYTLVEPSFLLALGIKLNQPIEIVNVVGVGGRRRLPCFVLERLHCFGMGLAAVRVLALEFSNILPSIHGVLGLRELRASQVTLDLFRNVVTTP